MVAYSNTTTAGASQAVASGPLYVTGNTGYVGLFCPTAQQLHENAVGQNTIIDVSERTATLTYMRGFAERIRIQTSSPLPWFWRRICFTTKGPDLRLVSSSDSPTNAASTFVDTSNGIERLWLNANVNNMNNTVAGWTGRVFKGAQGADWNDFITATVDTSRITLKSDVTRTLLSGNGVGTVKEYKTWYPMNHNLRYDDDEAGAFETSSYFSTDSRQGMGDYYILDFIQGGTGGATSDILQIQSTSTLYWHER